MAQAKIVNVDIVKTNNGLLRATSEDIKGLHVVSDTIESLKDRAKSMLRDIFLAEGKDVSVYETEGESPDITPPWVVVSNRSETASC